MAKDKNKVEAPYVPKHITVDLQGQKTQQIGANISARRKMRVVDERGSVIEGYFTQNRNVSFESEFNARMNEVNFPKGYEKLDNIREQIVKNPVKRYTFEKKLDDDYTSNYRSVSSKREKFDASKKKIYKAMVEAFKIDTTELDKLKDTAFFDDYLFTVVSEMARSENTYENYHIITEHQTANSNVNRRNNAISDYSELIHRPWLNARSTPMTLKDGKKVFHGSFMVNAKGVSIETLNDKTKGYGKKNIVMSAAGLRQISDLQVMDFLCGNVDRNGRNFFYQVDNSQKYDVVITGVQGIDNDASFGVIHGSPSDSHKRVYDRMSLIDDIKVIDADTAKEVLALKKEDVEKKIRLAGLSVEEIDAAGERLELLQEKIKSGKGIKILKSDSDWQKYITKDGKISEELTYQVGEGRNRVYNIFQNINDEIDAQAFRLKGDINGPDALDFDQGGDARAEEDEFDELEAEDNSVPTVKALNLSEHYALDDHIDYFNGIRSTLKKKFDGVSNMHIDDAYKELDKKMQSVMDWMQQKSDELKGKGKNEQYLNNNDRFMLADMLGELGKAAQDYAAANSGKDANYSVKLTVNSAKNIETYASYAREETKTAFFEADKNDVRREVEKFYHAQGKAATGHTFEKLTDNVKGLSGRCTKYYTRMMNALAAGKLSDELSYKEKMAKCKEMAEAAKGYLKHKVPDGSEAGLNKKERARVQFARNILEYAEQNAKFEKYKKEKERDCKNINSFRNECRDLVNAYRSATGIEKNNISDDIRDYGVKFAQGLTHILDVSDKYAKTDDMQKVCVKIMQGEIHDFMQAHLECCNKANGKNITDPYEALGLAPEYCERVKEMVNSVSEQIAVKNNESKTNDNSLVQGELISKDEREKAIGTIENETNGSFSLSD